MELKNFSEAIAWCEEGLRIDSKEKKLVEMRAKADKLKVSITGVQHLLCLFQDWFCLLCIQKLFGQRVICTSFSAVQFLPKAELRGGSAQHVVLRCGGKRAGALLEIQADFSAQQQSDDGQ